MAKRVQRTVMFNRPIWLAGSADNEDGIRPIFEIFGFTVGKHTKFDGIDLYVSYLCGCSKWQQEGCDVNGRLWVSREGLNYGVNHPMLKDYYKRARKEMGIKWITIETNKKLDEDTEGMLGEFVATCSLYNNLMEYGRKVDVQNHPCQKHQTSQKPVRRGKNTRKRHR